MARYLIIPGLAGSGPDHWQTHWERDLPNASRVEMPDWLAPRRADWVSTLDRAIRSASEPPVLIAHSLGCIAVAHWAALGTGQVRGALLVAPADLDRKGCPEALREFAPVPRAPLRFPSRVVASDNDPYGNLTQVIQIAFDWGSEVTVLASAGHINSDSGLGRWPEGRTLLHDFVGAGSRVGLEHADVRPARAGATEREPDWDDSRWIWRSIN
jgi:predicted alpha/beta hydrolase family esterase